MYLNRFGAFIFFFVSYIPLMIAFLIKYIISTYPDGISICNYIKSTQFITVLFIVGILIIFIIVFHMFIQRIKKDEYYKSKCEITELSNSEYMLFMITYLVPFVTIDFKVENLISFLFLFIIMGLIYTNTPLVAINPILNLMGYNLYKAMKSKNNIIIVSKNDLDMGYNELYLTPFYKNVYLEVINNEK